MPDNSKERTIGATVITPKKLTPEEYAAKVGLPGGPRIKCTECGVLIFNVVNGLSSHESTCRIAAAHPELSVEQMRADSLRLQAANSGDGDMSYRVRKRDGEEIVIRSEYALSIGSAVIRIGNGFQRVEILRKV
jgi:hypothetical protein